MRSDRAELQLIADADVQRVLEFMQVSIQAAKLVGVAESIPQMARLLWGRFPQEPVSPIGLELDPAAKTVLRNPSQAVSTELLPAPACVDDGSVGGAVCR
jgi:hypothetical protein